MLPHNMVRHTGMKSLYSYINIEIHSMKYNKLFGTLLSLAVLMLFGCGDDKNNVSSEWKGSIHGCVTDYATGNPVHNANVQLRPTGETTLTGSDGMYEFPDLKDGNYSITVSKAEYADLIDDYTIKVKDGRRMRRDVQIKKNQTYVRLTDMQGNDIYELDFGAEASMSLQSFNIYNNGTVTINCKLQYSCAWVTSVTDVPNSIKPGQNAMVSVEIDRSKLEAGQNSTVLYVTTNNGNNALVIKAVGETILPNVMTLPVTNAKGEITPWCNTFHAEVTSVGNPAYYKRGFCYSSTNSMPTINDNRIDVSGTGLGEYSYTCYDLGWTTTKYYVRSWLMYGTNNQIQYGNVQSFVFNDL